MRTLKDFKNYHEGPCFILGTGPSLELITKYDITDYPTIGINTIGDYYDPTYLVHVDRLDLKHLHGIINGVDIDAKYRRIADTNCQYVFSPRAMDYYKHALWIKINMVNASEKTPWGYIQEHKVVCATGSMPASICLAAYMGFKQIGIIGWDLIGHHHFSKPQIIDEVNGVAKYLYEDFRQHGIELYNLSDQTLVHTLPKWDIESFKETYEVHG